ncbi:MAG: hypothetical protein V3V98_07360 [Thermoplasmata archaeon]
MQRGRVILKTSLVLIVILWVMPAFLGLIGVSAASGNFAPPHSDYGLDTDGDSYYNYLVFNASVQIDEADTYLIDGNLRDGGGGLITNPDIITRFLEVGSHVIAIDFEGIDIYNHGEHGPYTVNLALYDTMWNTLDTDTALTNSYLYTEFQYPPAMFDPAHYDYGLDTNSNSLYDYLVAQVNITAYTADTYKIKGNLKDSTDTWYIAQDENQSYFSTGDHTVELRMYGYQIRGKGYDGPYLLRLEIIKGSSQVIAEDTHTTAAYLHTDFEGQYAYFVPPHSDTGIDMDGDTDFEYLRVTLEIQVNESGYYTVSGDLWDKSQFNYITSASNYTNLNTGSVQVDLDFLGCEICQSGYGVFYYADVEIHLEDGTPADADEHQTNGYQSSDFDCEPPIVFSPPHSDYGLDTDLDTYYNYLVADISIDASVSGTYRVTGRLFDSSHTTFITLTENTSYLTTGANVLPLWLDGTDIYNSGIDGPYNLTLLSYDVYGNKLERAYYDTNSYTYDQFQRDTIDNDPPTISDVRATPSPQKVFHPVNITAIVWDNFQLDGVWVDILDPDDLPVGNFSMLYDSGSGRHYFERSYSGAGDYSCVISASDASANWNSSPCSFLMVDSAPPVLLRAILTGGNLEDVTIEWELSLDDGQGFDDVVNYVVYWSASYDSSGAGYHFLTELPPGTTSLTLADWGDGDWSDYFFYVQSNHSDGREKWRGQAGKFVRFLEAGKRIASVPLVQANEALKVVLGSLSGSYNHVRYYKSSDQKDHWKCYWTFKTYRDLYHINHQMGFWIQMTKDDRLVVAGLVPDVTEIHLNHQWNFVGYPSFMAMQIQEALADVDYKMVDGYGDTPPFHLVHLADTDMMVAGEGYWVWVGSSQTWFVYN